MEYDDTELKRRAATHMMHVTGPLAASIEARLSEETGFRLVDNEALRIVEQVEGPLRMTDIAVRLIVSKAGATKVVDRLEAQGLVRRTQDASDRRSYLVETTDAGRTALASMRPVVDAAIAAMWSRHLSRDEAKTLLELADRLSEANPDWYA